MLFVFWVPVELLVVERAFVFLFAVLVRAVLLEPAAFLRVQVRLRVRGMALKLFLSGHAFLRRANFCPSGILCFY